MTDQPHSHVVSKYGLEGVREHWMPGNFRRQLPAREKRPFESEADARAFLVEHGHGPDWSAYVCHVCEKWHVASPKRR